MANRMRPIHPGEILKEEFLAPTGMSASQLARYLGVPINCITQILRYNRSITGDTALRLSRFFKTSPEFWMNLQATYDLREAQGRVDVCQISKIMPIDLHKCHSFNKLFD
jgi:addiction module HigA family antidote